LLKNTFQHIPGIGKKTEERFWESGIQTWETFKKSQDARLLRNKTELIRSHIDASETAASQSDIRYFSDMLPAGLHWRFFPEFRHSAVYLDIETDGLDPYDGTITTIAMYDGHSIYTYVKDQNLDDFMDDIEKYQMIITYNGKCFDVPFIENYMGIEMAHAHIDLRYVLAALGYKGGLKGCEAALGINRGQLKGVDGFFAVLLWQEYVSHNNQKALETLLAYNIEDVVNLETLMVMAYNMNLKATPFSATHAIELPSAPKIPYHADLGTIEKIKRKQPVDDWNQSYW